MKEIVPDYYKDFRCIADKCRHSCCIGWEIDIDEETLDLYNSIDGILGEKLKASITHSDGSSFFTLDEKERCPFLNEKNLCEIILNKGENCLCQICSDHPRFRSFFDSHIEIGLGLCCEAAGDLILKNTDTVSFAAISDSSPALFPDTDFFRLREAVFSILQNRCMSFEDRIDELLSVLGLNFKKDNIQKLSSLYSDLEYMNPDLKNLIEETDFSCTENPFTSSEWDTAFEQLTVYFIFRHLADGMYDGLFNERILFSVLSYYIIKHLLISQALKTGKVNLDDLIEISRIYSSEIEYSEDNIFSILKGL